MQQWVIRNDKIFSRGDVAYLGVPYEDIQSGKIGTLPKNYDGWFPFMRMCYSVGDLGITSGIFEALKQKYPNIKIAFASKEYVDYIFGPEWVTEWGYDSNNTGATNIDLVMVNNPFIDKIFNPGEFDIVFSDHDRSYTGLVYDGEMIRSCDEPLAEQILRRFGFTDDDFKTIDASPKLYFTQDEINKCDKVIEEYMGSSDYGCLLLASRLPQYKGKEVEGIEHLFPYLEKYKNKPVFCYTDHDLSNTKWVEYFPSMIDFSKLGLSIREQIYIKQKALFNTGIQAGVTDVACGGNTDAIILCLHKTIRENCIRGTRYVYVDGSSKII